MDILVFKTNVTEQHQLRKIQSLLMPVTDIKQWTVDLEDCDKVLRIECNDLNPREIEQLLFASGMFCRELED